MLNYLDSIDLQSWLFYTSLVHMQSTPQLFSNYILEITIR